MRPLRQAQGRMGTHAADGRHRPRRHRPPTPVHEDARCLLRVPPPPRPGHRTAGGDDQDHGDTPGVDPRHRHPAPAPRHQPPDRQGRAGRPSHGLDRRRQERRPRLGHSHGRRRRLPLQLHLRPHRRGRPRSTAQDPRAIRRRQDHLQGGQWHAARQVGPRPAQPVPPRRALPLRVPDRPRLRRLHGRPNLQGGRHSVPGRTQGPPHVQPPRSGPRAPPPRPLATTTTRRGGSGSRRSSTSSSTAAAALPRHTT